MFLNYLKNYIKYLVFVVVIAPNLVAVIFKIDAWPISYFPMFSRSPNSQEIVVYRMKVLFTNGNALWWDPPHSYHSRDFGYKFNSAVMRYGVNNKEALRKVVLRFHSTFENRLKEKTQRLLVIQRIAKWKDSKYEITDNEIFSHEIL